MRNHLNALRHPLPPGPPARPVIGNILSFPPTGGWHVLTEYKKTYGDLVFFHGLGNNILVLNSLAAINDLLDKRGEIYSDRPSFTVVGELMGLGQSLPLLPYGKQWREQRKLAHAALSLSSIKKYYKIQEDMAAMLNEALLDDPNNFCSHVRLTAGRIILSLTYGLSVDTADDQYITHAEKTMELIGKATVPGAFLCDFIPAMRYLPAWVSFQREAKKGRAMIESLVTKPFEHVKQEIADNTVLRPSLTSDLLSVRPQEGISQSEFESHIKWAAGSMYGAHSYEQTYATIICFIMAMALNPEKQKLAQEEIDRIVGKDRIPTMEDRELLPYVNATIKEVLRWHPALPLSIARMATKDDIYEGHTIPKGTIIVPNVWCVLETYFYFELNCNKSVLSDRVIAHEPSADFDEQVFLPERFLAPDVTAPDPGKWAFGFGRRICPGRALAENSLFVIIAGILSVFNISPPAEGDLKVEFSPNLVSYPENFKCQIIPRSQRKSALAHQRAKECL
ncbi:hypothetical protein HYPSUDRAFT_66825 [Hypholoma sublateritium FD-334 SS-4]|uniref:Cytochrome P450 n=1 Tax=Hypholoma sublateritium (strain FD-334 SS-4) TaxID=945553 RepID=A0A0D2NVK6_HYPSF|nr:hypothetical protein HYPSUDRAFT_66825 [Hypholoma sublateritium FD-334 SS-4]